MKTIEIPIRTVSEANQRCHWRVKAKRAKEHRGLTLMYCALTTLRPPLPCTVKLTRKSARLLDDDNLRSALKACRDGIADWFEVNDRDPRLKWEYDQVKGKPPAVIVEVM